MINTVLQKLRKKHNYSQEYVAKFIGLTRQAYSNYELGTREPDLETVKKLAMLYGVTSDYLLGHNHEIIETKDDDDDNMIREEVGDGYYLLFHDRKKVTPEQVRIIKAVLQERDEGENNKK